MSLNPITVGPGPPAGTGRDADCVDFAKRDAAVVPAASDWSAIFIACSGVTTRID